VAESARSGSEEDPGSSARREPAGPKPGPQLPLRGGRKLSQAVATAVVLLLILIVCYALGPTAFFWLAAVVILLSLFELFDALHRSGRRTVAPFGLLCGFGLLLAAYFRPGRPELVVAFFGATVLGAFLLALRPARGMTPASDAAWTVLAVTWIGGAGAAAVSMLTLHDGLNLLVAHVLITALDDIGAYFAGVGFGSHKLAPSISPGKSWEGFLGGVAAALAGGAVFGALLDVLGVVHGLAIAAIIGLLAPAGDLAESMAKRELGLKDSGRLLPGHGGFLDLLDAILFCAPPVLLYLRVVVG
jgi:phosphatidate cytidylyltransferase